MTASASLHGWRLRLGLALSRARAGVNDLLDRDLPPMSGPVATCFVVGCGNSGTTLVAGRLGLHPDAYTIPHETTMFRSRRRLLRTRSRLIGYMDEARAAGASVLVEKTPKHVHNIDRIRRLLPAAQVIVVQRNPFDTALSLKARTGNLDAGIERWLLDNGATLGLPEDAATTRVRYERLTAEPETEMRRLLGFLGLGWNSCVLEAGETAYSRHNHAPGTMRLRTRQVAEPIRSNSGKWRSALTPAEVAHVRQRTADLWQALGGDPETGDWRS